MISYPNHGSKTLSDSHQGMLYDDSGIDPKVAAERGYYTARSRSQIPQEFKDYQRRLGLVVPTYSPDGATTGLQLRPDKPRKPKLKYESPGESEVIVDTHPRCLAEVNAGTGDLFVVEGVKKADALVSRGAAAIALTGVWMAHVPKSRPKRLLRCWNHVRLEGRRVFVVFDSDWQSNDNVHDALKWLVEALTERGADVRVAYLDDRQDGSKRGADDFLVAGGTVAQLKALCRRFEEQDVSRIRLTKDEKLRAGIEDLERRFWSTEWRGRGGATARDVYLMLIEAARRQGKIHPDGIRVKKAQGPLALAAAISTRTVWRALNRLEDAGLLYRDNSGRRADKTGAFVLISPNTPPRAKVSHIDQKHRTEDNETNRTKEGNVTEKLQGYDAGDLPLRAPRYDAGDLPPCAPRLRWSRPSWKPSKAVREKYRKGEISRIPDPRERIERLGKTRSAMIDALATRGALTLGELAVLLHHKRPRDLGRRSLPMLVEVGIVVVASPSDGGVLRLADGWRAALEDQRTLGKEVEADSVARKRYELKSRAFHARDRKAKTSRGSEAGRENIARSRKAKAAHKTGPGVRAVLTTEQERRIRELVREGMAERFARADVLKRPHDISGSPGAAPGPTERKKLPEKVSGIYVHGGECDCEWCAA